MTDAQAIPIRLNVELIQQAREVVAKLGTRYGESPAPGQSTAGAHFRHIVDHYQVLLAGLESGRVDYYTRARDPELEASPDRMASALSNIEGTIQGLGADLDKPLRVDTGGAAHEGGEARWAVSSVRRELAFVLSHTLHHMATIASVARTLGVDLDASVGVAHSTAAHRSRASAAQASAGAD